MNRREVAMSSGWLYFIVGVVVGVIVMLVFA